MEKYQDLSKNSGVNSYEADLAVDPEWKTGPEKEGLQRIDRLTQEYHHIHAQEL